MSIQYSKLEHPLKLERGGVLHSPVVAFSTYGRLNEDKSNVILVCHALTANSVVPDWWEGIFGDARILDPAKDFIICINNLGSPYGTSSPKTDDESGKRYGLDFPDYTIKDTARLHIEFLSTLGIERIKMIIGGSCGGNVSQEIAVLLGEKVESQVLMCCSARETPWVIAIHESQRIVMRSDPDFVNKEGGKSLALRGARAFALPFYRSHASFEIKQSEEDPEKYDDFKASSYIRYQGEKFISRYDVHCYYKQLIALDTHNIGRNRGGIQNALGKISARTLCIGFSSDVLVPVIEQKRLAEDIPGAVYEEINTPFGHDSFLIETDKINKAVINWSRSRKN